jgi:SAM-dependent methyltransferase
MNEAAPQDRYITRCPVGCSADFDVTDIALPEGPLLRCRACGQLASQIGEAAYWASMRAFDAPDYNLPDEHASDRRMENATRRLTRVCELLGKPAFGVRLLDVGCSRGDFVAAAQTLGFDAEGVEPAPHIAEAGRAAGRKIYTGRLEDQAFADASFDAATLFEVIEHLREPIPTLREIRRILKPGGVLLLSTGNGASWTARVLKQRWDYFQTRVDAGHISFFNPGSIALAAQRAGFEVADLYTARVRLVIKGQVSGPAYAAGKLAAELLNYPARLFGRGHDMIAYLRRVG